jgi:purine-binding chemotaxis protein CheW
MSNQIKSNKARGSDSDAEQTEEFVTFWIAGQLFGIPVLQIQDVLSSYKITRIPLAPPEITGSLNLRGRVVTAIDLRLRLGLPARPADADSMSIVAENGGELYSLMVDSVGEVMALSQSAYERNLPTLDAKFRAFSDGIYRLDDQLLVVLDVNRMLDYENSAAA